jgi:hypothetical protein
VEHVVNSNGVQANGAYAVSQPPVVVPRGDVDTTAIEVDLRELSRAELGGESLTW